MGIAVPDQIDHLDFGILWIAGGFNTDLPPGPGDINNEVISMLANDTKVIAGYVKQVPNQPVVFWNDPDEEVRIEDTIIAWTWRTYLDAPVKDNTVIARMPMTKAAKRGLDTIYEFTRDNIPGADIQRFGITGVSKRGWTAWSLAATDQRVVAMVPMVFSMLNVESTLMSHYQKLDGGWSFALSPYYNENLTQALFDPVADGLFDVEDMYRYRERFTIPILEVLSSGDEFFLCDESIFWWNAIPSANKFMLMLANAEHIMAQHYQKIYDSALNFLLTFLQGTPFPSVSWDMFPTSTGAETIFYASPPPEELRAYRAQTLGNDTRRDFRLLAASPEDFVDVSVHPVFWRQNLTIDESGVGVYRISQDEVPGEWVGFFFESEWTGPAGTKMIFTSQVNVVPNTYPHEPCTDAASCYGTLV